MATPSVNELIDRWMSDVAIVCKALVSGHNARTQPVDRLDSESKTRIIHTVLNKEHVASSI